MLGVEFHTCSEIDQELVGFAVIAAWCNGKWIFSRHRDRATWEIPGGHREPGERVDETAKRELYEETGAVSYDLEPICIYSVKKEGRVTFGQLYYAEVFELGELPGFEICQIIQADGLPQNLTYPLIQPLLFDKTLAFLDIRHYSSSN